jgi:hypothetical protein
MTSSDLSREKPSAYFHRLGKALLGRPEPAKREVEIRSPGTIAADLAKIPESDWWKYAFSREPMNGRFNDEERKDMYDKAVACGKQYAEKAIAEYGSVSSKELAGKMGLQVSTPDMPQSTSRVLFADFEEPDTIHVYEDGLRRGEILLKKPGVLNAFGGKPDIENILTAHELFHVVELRNPEIWTKTYSVVLWKAGPLTNHSGVSVLSEIAAMAFAKRLTGISFSPYLLDAFLVYGYSEGNGSQLYEEMMTDAGRTPSKGKVKLV